MRKDTPKALERIFFFYPLFQGLGILSSLGFVILQKNFFISIISLLFFSYILSPLLWLFIKKVSGEFPTNSYMGKKVKSGNLWLISYQLQFLYNTIRLFEALLLFVPGLYSFWLRLWGSSIGEKILWAPNVSIIDRNLIDIGDRVLLGNNSYLSSHIIKKRERGRYQIYVKKIKIENDAVISFGSNLSAGVVIGEQSFIPAKSDLYPNTNVLGGENYAQ